MTGTSRVVAALSVVALLGGCTARQRNITSGGFAAVALFGVGVYLHGALRQCEPTPGSDDSDICEEGRHDEKNRGGVIAIGGAVAAIIAQLWPVPDDPSDREPVTEVPRTVEAPPPSEAAKEDAAKLRDPAAVQLAENARAFAAAGKCIEAFGSLTALRRIDPGLADQLQAWDPVVSRCRRASDAQAQGIPATPAPTPPGPPGETAPTP